MNKKAAFELEGGRRVRLWLPAWRASQTERKQRALEHTGLIYGKRVTMSEAKAGIDDAREEDESGKPLERHGFLIWEIQENPYHRLSCPLDQAADVPPGRLRWDCSKQECLPHLNGTALTHLHYKCPQRRGQAGCCLICFSNEARNVDFFYEDSWFFFKMLAMSSFLSEHHVSPWETFDYRIATNWLSLRSLHYTGLPCDSPSPGLSDRF